MTLRQKQSVFLDMVGKLICHAQALGITIFVLEWYRSEERQAQLRAAGKSWIARSKHQDGLAVDLVVMDGRGVTWDVARYKPLGEFWKSIGGTWGGDWKVVDAVHFEYK
jgi:hypothetical protein